MGRPYRDAMGLTFGCHLMNMEIICLGDRASKDGISERYLDKVLDISLETTKTWFEENRPDYDDPLRPLRFTYL